MADRSSRDRSARAGRAARDTLAPESGGRWRAPSSRRDPIGILAAHDADRIADLIPVRYGRMSASPFAFLRGSAAVMAADLAAMPTTGLAVQACGDAQLSNFGAVTSVERGPVFDITDFDETLSAPWEHDVRRLAASVVVAAREAGVAEGTAGDCVTALARCYRERMHDYAGMTSLEVWYSTVPLDEMPATESGARPQRSAARDTRHAIPMLTELVADRVIRAHPPTVQHLADAARDEVRATFHRYIDNLPEDRQHLLSRFTIDDVALKAAGVSSVGVRCFVLLLHGWDADDRLILQVKQADHSVLERAGYQTFSHHGRRVVVGQRRLQGVGDVALGWASGTRGRHYYVRQLWDPVISFDPDGLDAGQLEAYARACARALARGHARTGNPVELSGYLGAGDEFDRALAGFALDYADQTERDHAALQAAIRSGRISAETGA